MIKKIFPGKFLSLKKGILALGMITFGASISVAMTMNQAMEQAAAYFTNPSLGITSDKMMLVQVINYHSRKTDSEARKLETELYLTIQRKNPAFQMVLLSEAAAGVSDSKAIYLNGTFERQGEIIILRLQALKGGLTGIMIGQTEVKFNSEKQVTQKLVAVLDLEADFMPKNQKKAYSEIFRSELVKLASFDIASSAEVDKMDPDAIQKTAGCSRDECATIIGEQLGVDSVIASNVFKINDKSYVLSGKLIDIKDNSIISSATVNHKASLDSIDLSLKILAEKLIKTQKAGQSKKNTGVAGMDSMVVFNFAGSNTSREEISALSDRLRVELIKEKSFILVDQGYVKKALSEIGISNQTCSEMDCALKAGLKLEAGWAVIGKVTKFSDKMWLVTGKLININTEQIIHAESIQHEGTFFDLLGKGMTVLADKLLLKYKKPDSISAFKIPSTSKPALIPTLPSGVIKIATGYYSTCFNSREGNLSCWGFGKFGQLGNGSRISSPRPLKSTIIDSIIDVAFGYRHTCAVKSKGQSFCWGFGGEGNLGIGKKTNIQLYPGPVSGLTNVVKIAAGDYHSCAVQSDGKLACWGRNRHGQLGTGNKKDHDSPVFVSSITSAKQVTAGEAHTCALVEGGKVMCWGYGKNGNLGLGKEVKLQFFPGFVSGIEGAVQISSGIHHNCALINDGTIKCWGEGSEGQLGNSSNGDAYIPMQVSDITSAINISAGNNHSCAVLQDGSIKCWGAGSKGQLGNGSKRSSNLPVAVSSINNAIQVSAGKEYTCALTNDDKIFCWGEGGDGQLGNGTKRDSDVPSPVQGNF